MVGMSIINITHYTRLAALCVCFFPAERQNKMLRDKMSSHSRMIGLGYFGINVVTN